MHIATAAVATALAVFCAVAGATNFTLAQQPSFTVPVSAAVWVPTASADGGLLAFDGNATVVAALDFALLTAVATVVEAAGGAGGATPCTPTSVPAIGRVPADVVPSAWATVDATHAAFYKLSSSLGQLVRYTYSRLASPYAVDAVDLRLGFPCIAPGTPPGGFVNNTQVTSLAHNPMGNVTGMVWVADQATLYLALYISAQHNVVATFSSDSTVRMYAGGGTGGWVSAGRFRTDVQVCCHVHQMAVREGRYLLLPNEERDYPLPPPTPSPALPPWLLPPTPTAAAPIVTRAGILEIDLETGMTRWAVGSAYPATSFGTPVPIKYSRTPLPSCTPGTVCSTDMVFTMRHSAIAPLADGRLGFAFTSSSAYNTDDTVVFRYDPAGGSVQSLDLALPSGLERARYRVVGTPGYGLCVPKSVDATECYRVPSGVVACDSIQAKCDALKAKCDLVPGENVTRSGPCYEALGACSAAVADCLHNFPRCIA